MKCRALTQVFLENIYYKEGQVFEYYGPYNRHLEPVVTHDGLNWVPMSPPPADWVPQAKRARVAGEDTSGTALAQETQQLATRVQALEVSVQAAVAAAEQAATAAMRAVEALQAASKPAAKKPARRRAG